LNDPSAIKEIFERNIKLLNLKPSKGQYTTSTKIRLKEGTACEVEHKHWTFKADVGRDQGGKDEGPGPGILFRASVGSCLAIGYKLWAAYMDLEIDHIEVDVEADVDARGNYGIDNAKPGYTGMRYKVTIASPEPKERILEMIQHAYDHSPILANVRNPINMEREVDIVKRHDSPLTRGD
jgi:uncharacterized OsmC-like protein